jgi:hypothetical protein
MDRSLLLRARLSAARIGVLEAKLATARLLLEGAQESINPRSPARRVAVAGRIARGVVATLENGIPSLPPDDHARIRKQAELLVSRAELTSDAGRRE